MCVCVADKWVNIFRRRETASHPYSLLNIATNVSLEEKKRSGIFYLTFEVLTTLSHLYLSFHLRLQRVNTLRRCRRLWVFA